jgi:cell wall-associated NlpC family hydrolase
VNFAQYVGAEYELRGCWELLRRVYAEQLGVELPSYAERAEDMDRAKLSALIESERTAWLAIPAGAEQAGDAALFRVMGHDSHIGVVVGAGWMLHARPGTNAVIESYRGPQWARRLQHFYRHRDVV